MGNKKLSYLIKHLLSEQSDLGKVDIWDSKKAQFIFYIFQHFLDNIHKK